jgi:threonine dehydratase
MAAAAVENLVNGINGEQQTPSRPRTPSLKNSLSLTEYSANPTPPNGSPSPRSKLHDVVPEEFILPSGYPDVYMLSIAYQLVGN